MAHCTKLSEEELAWIIEKIERGEEEEILDELARLCDVDPPQQHPNRILQIRNNRNR